jgi:hypothetical protein
VPPYHHGMRHAAAISFDVRNHHGRVSAGAYAFKRSMPLGKLGKIRLSLLDECGKRLRRFGGAQSVAEQRQFFLDTSWHVGAPVLYQVLGLLNAMGGNAANRAATTRSA